MVDTHLSILVQDFLAVLRQQLKIRVDQPLRLRFGCKTLLEGVTLSENGLRGQDTVSLSVPLAGGLQGAHTSDLIPFSGKGKMKMMKWPRVQILYLEQ